MAVNWLSEALVSIHIFTLLLSFTVLMLNICQLCLIVCTSLRLQLHTSWCPP